MIEFAGLEPGTWVELVVGGGSALVALALGFVAVRQAKSAAIWAKVAAEAQQHANELAEAALHVEFRSKLEVELYHADPDEGRGQPYDAWVFLEISSGGASVWLHEVKTSFSFFGLKGGIWTGNLGGGPTLNPLGDVSFPKLLYAGDGVQFENPWGHFSPVRADTGAASLTVTFSATRNSQLRQIEVSVAIPPPLAKTWKELAAMLSQASLPNKDPSPS